MLDIDKTALDEASAGDIAHSLTNYVKYSDRYPRTSLATTYSVSFLSS